MRSKIVSLAAILVTSGLSLSAQPKQVIDTTYANNSYKHRLAFFKQMPDTRKEIIFLGNSLTEAGEWQELTGNPRVKNRGISGDVTYGIIARLDEVLSSNPAKVFILTGTNDLKRGIPIASITATFERMLSIIKTQSPKTKIYLQSVFPVNEAMTGESYKKITNEVVVLLNEKLKLMAPKYGSVYVDLHHLLTDSNGQLKKEYTLDGIHLWPDAYKVWVDYLKSNNYL
jgi:lysophospholipase L1-like esterase